MSDWLVKGCEDCGGIWDTDSPEYDRCSACHGIGLVKATEDEAEEHQLFRIEKLKHKDTPKEERERYRLFRKYLK